MKEAVKVFKALSDETRLKIFKWLLGRESSVAEVTQALNISQTCASRSLSILNNAGFLKLRREGSWSLYSINEETPKEYVADLINIVKKAIANSEIAETGNRNVSNGRGEKKLRTGLGW